MRSIQALLALSILACNDPSDEVSKDQPLAIPAGDDGRPARPAEGGDRVATERGSVTVALREQLARARIRYESLKAQAAEQGQKVAASTDQLLQKTKDRIDAAEAKLDKVDQVAANELAGFEKEMSRELDAIDSDLKALGDSLAGEEGAAASLEVEEDHD
jgi:hypothetical protein